MAQVLKHCKRVAFWGFFAFLLAPLELLAADITFENNVGVKLLVTQQPAGYALRSFWVDGKQVEVSLTKGMLAFRNKTDGRVVWLCASKTDAATGQKGVFSGKGAVADATIKFRVTLEVPNEFKAIKITYAFSSDKNLPNWQAVLAFHSEFGHGWKCHMYPWAEDAKFIQQDPLTYMGIPSLFLYRDDRSLGLLWGMDPNWDYLDPTTWTKDTGLYFIDGAEAPQYRLGGPSLQGNFQYEVPMQIVLTANSEPDGMITDLVKNWIGLNHYWPTTLEVRSNDAALELFIEGRKRTDMWYPGEGYRLEMGDPASAFIYIGEQGLNAYFDYLIYELTGDRLWRTRAFEQMDFILKAQNTNPDDASYGVIQTAFNLTPQSPGGPGFNSVDRGNNVGYKLDLNAHLARYMLLTWKRVKDHEGVDRKDWYNSTVLAANWVLRQQNSDGGLPQKVEIQPVEDRMKDDDWMGTGQPHNVRTRVGEKSISVASGRALPALQWISRITNDAKYQRFLDSVESYTLTSVQNQYYYTGHHPDLPSWTLEEGSIWGICEFWLNKYDATGDSEYLKHAVADAYLALTWWCPKQLGWVKNPTLGGSAEQQYYLQYSVYSYQDRKPECLVRLYEATRDPLFEALAKRVFQNIFWTQVTEGNLMGATHERIADPWQARRDEVGRADFNSLGTTYMGEQSVDAFLQAVELYRTGHVLYYGENVVNKVYPDGIVYYSSDITDKRRVDLAVLPSEGTIKITVLVWSKEEKKWTEGDSTIPKITVRHTVGDLKPNTWYEARCDGNDLGRYDTDPEGVLTFTYSGSLTSARSLEIKESR